MNSLILKYFETRVRINLINVDILEYLEKKYCPIIDIIKSNHSADYTIDASIGNRLFKFYHNSNYHRIVVHGGKNKEYYLSAWRKIDISNGTVYIRIEKYHTSIIVRPKLRYIYCSSSDINDLYKTIDTIIVELFYRSREIIHKSFHFHASALANNNNAIVFIGGKNAGKTRYLFELITKYGYDYICNDNCFIELNKNRLFVLSWFEDIKLKTELLDKYSLDISKCDCYEYSYDKTKLFIPLGCIQNMLNFNINIQAKPKWIVRLNYNENYCSIEEGWNKNAFISIVDSVYLPHNPEHYEFMNLFDEFNENRFDDFSNLQAAIKEKVIFINLCYDDNSISKAIDLLINEINK